MRAMRKVPRQSSWQEPPGSSTPCRLTGGYHRRCWSQILLKFFIELMSSSKQLARTCTREEISPATGHTPTTIEMPSRSAFVGTETMSATEAYYAVLLH